VRDGVELLLHRGDLAVHLVRDAAVGTALGHQGQDPPFVRGQLVERIGDPAAGHQFADDDQKVWADYESANWYWTEMTKRITSSQWDAAKAHFEQYKKYDDSAVQRANQLGYSSCNHTWPRPTGW
jgi:hypothetical protein